MPAVNIVTEIGVDMRCEICGSSVWNVDEDGDKYCLICCAYEINCPLRRRVNRKRPKWSNQKLTDEICMTVCPFDDCCIKDKDFGTPRVEIYEKLDEAYEKWRDNNENPQ